MDGVARLTQLPGYALAQAYRSMRHAMDDALRDLGLTTPQWGTLLCLRDDDGLSGADMARIHHLTPQTMNTILHNLEHGGLIVRESHPEHRVLLRVRLTDLGRQRLEQATQRVDTVQKRMLADLDDEQRRLLLELLERCTHSLRADGFTGTFDATCEDD